jgi:putative oxidoreductase
MNISTKLPQLLLRISLGIGFIVPVLDRLGQLGLPGEKNISWGNWENFIGYTGLLLPFLSPPMVNVMGTLATILELIIGLALIMGIKTRLAALGSFGLTLSFAICMILFVGFKAPVNFAVFPVCAGSFLLAAIPTYEWSIDQYFSNSRKNS